MTGSENALLELVAQNVEYVRGRLDTVDTKVDDLRVQVEHRLTRLEGKAALIALLISAAVSLAAATIAR